MRTRFRSLYFLVGLPTLLVACVPVTVNINFSQEKLDSAAGRIEDMVRSPENPKPPESAPNKPSSALDQALAVLAPRDAEAQGVPDVKVQTPQLMKVIASRRARFGKIQEWATNGCLGENNQGLVEVRPGQGCGGEVGALVGAENADRQFVYDELMRQNNIPASDATRVRAAFARANRERAGPGVWIQLENGQWAKK